MKNTRCLNKQARASDKFQHFRDILAHLDKLGLFHADMRLERVKRVLAGFGLTRPPYVTTQVLGTNGKGSTSAFLASLCAAHGLRTGLYTSPHFLSPRERIIIDGDMASEEDWLCSANELMPLASDLTYFEWLTALAVLLFTRRSVDVAIFEAGLGGRHDATTAIEADLLCFTPIALDHCDVLGSGLQKIAADKAAAIRGNAAVVTATQYPQAAERLAAAAKERKVRLVRATALTGHATAQFRLAGTHQSLNAGLALEAWRQLAPMLNCAADNVDAQALGLRRAFLPGRLQRLAGNDKHPALLLDGAHNPHGMQALVNTLRETDIRPAAAIFSCLADKDWRPSVMQLKRFLGDVPLFVPALQNTRAAPAEEIAAVCNSAGAESARPVKDLYTALDILRSFSGVSPEHPVLLTGSLYLLAEFYTLCPNALTEEANP